MRNGRQTESRGELENTVNLDKISFVPELKLTEQGPVSVLSIPLVSSTCSGLQ